MIRLIRGGIWLLGAVHVLLCLALCAAWAALGALLMMSGSGLTLSHSRVALWPEAWPAIEIYRSGAPWHLAAAGTVLIVLLPLGIALLETAYARFAPSRPAPSAPPS